MIGSIYVLTNSPGDSMCSGLNIILETANSFFDLILGGDFNAKNTSWGDLSDNINGKHFLKLVQDHCFEITRISHHKPSYPNGNSFLDHFLLSAHLVNTEVPNYIMVLLRPFPAKTRNVFSKLRVKSKSSSILYMLHRFKLERF